MGMNLRGTDCDWAVLRDFGELRDLTVDSQEIDCGCDDREVVGDELLKFWPVGLFEVGDWDECWGGGGGGPSKRKCVFNGT
jgi:hypothetical protein